MRANKLVVAKLITLADTFDKGGLRKDADLLDQLVSRASRGEDFEDLMSLFEDTPKRYESEMIGQEDVAPGQVMRLPEEDLDLSSKELAHETEKSPAAKTPNRLEALKRRNELLKMRKMLDNELKELEPEVSVKDADEPVVDVETGFEDEEDDDENDADDQENTTLDTVINYVKEHPELLSLLLAL